MKSLIFNPDKIQKGTMIFVQDEDGNDKQQFIFIKPFDDDCIYDNYWIVYAMEKTSYIKKFSLKSFKEQTRKKSWNLIRIIGEKK